MWLTQILNIHPPFFSFQCVIDILGGFGEVAAIFTIH
jgi:hypothetical protein